MGWVFRKDCVAERARSSYPGPMDFTDAMLAVIFISYGGAAFAVGRSMARDEPILPWTLLLCTLAFIHGVVRELAC